MNGGNAYATIMFAILVIGLIALIAAFAFGAIDLLVCVVACIVLIIVVAFIIIYLIGGIFYTLKRRDTTHAGSSQGLGDIQEVDREMEPKNKE